MKKKLILGVLILAIAIVGGFFYFNDRPIKIDENESPKIYSSIDMYNKSKETLLGSVRIENNKIVSTVTDNNIKGFINTNKTLWETSKLEYPTGGKTETGALWDGVAETSIGDKSHIISIYTVLREKYGDDYYIDLVEENDK